MPQPRYGSQSPTFEQLQKFTKTDGDKAALLAKSFWGEPLEWQQRILDILLARDEYDKYLTHTFGLSVPRQNGKSWAIRARCFYGLLADGEKILYTCQHGDTADEMFKALSAPFEDEDEDELRDKLKAVRKTNGQQAIYLKNGGYIRFTTRTNSLARGKSYDTIIYDEAQDLTRAQQEASLPTIAASAKKNTQIIYLGTPPNAECQGDVFASLHDRVHNDELPEVAWMEWAADKIGDPFDKERWYATNPSLGYLITETSIEGETTLTPDGFARERLGWWKDVGIFNAVISRTEWADCETESPEDGPISYGIKFHPDGSRCALSAAMNGSTPHIELIDIMSTATGTRKLAQWLYERRSNTCSVSIDGRNGSEALINQLIELGYPQKAIVRPTAANVIAAATGLLEAVRAKELTHIKSDALDASATGAAKRLIGSNGGWGFGDGVEDATPVESAALALWTAKTTHRDPTRKVRIL